MNERVVATIDELLERLEDTEEIRALKQLEQLKAERSMLLQKIKLCYGTYEKANLLLLEATEMLSSLQTIAGMMEEKQAVADNKWLAYWGIELGESGDTS